MAELPPAYEWLNGIEELPLTIREGLKLLGTTEVVGKGSNRTIIEWRDELNHAGHKISGYADDDIPWCGLFVAFVTWVAGKTPVVEPLWAKNWINFGVKTAPAGLGDVLVFTRPTGGHVGFYVAEDDTAYHVLGGNQSNKVNITRVDKDRCIAVRRPVYRKQPAGVERRFVVSTGELSTDEA